ncbi:MAG: glutamate formimidoyltransferase [Planctomycetes bacterium]|nr:glutamate formimidoyltransferase [Planctomycetota bacterium]
MLVECVPNFSEGRDLARIALLKRAASGVVGANLLDVHQDPDHNRAVLTLAGEAEAVLEAAFQTVATAVSCLDLRTHQGVHPRIGAADVVPFVPLEGATLADCAELARRLGERLASELELPIYLYGAAATSPERALLPWLRKPGFEGLAAALQSTERAPDFGPALPHPSAGATAVGAREFLLAFNVDLASEDLALARQIARAIRTSSGGLPGVQAKGLALPSQGCVQVSMNLNDLRQTGPGAVYQEIHRLAKEAGVEIASSELVGLMPEIAVHEVMRSLLKLRQPLPERVLEHRLREVRDPGGPLAPYLMALASDAPDAPGGGSAVALALALGEACLRKALALSTDERGSLAPADLTRLEAQLTGSSELIDAARADHRAFAELMAHWKSPKGTPGRKQALAAARSEAIRVPTELLERALRLAEAAAEVAARGNPNLINDAAAAAELASAAARVARLNARSNQRRREREPLQEPLARIEAALAKVRQDAERLQP